MQGRCFVLSGDLDYVRCGDVRHALSELQRGSVVDLSAVRLIDASFLGILASHAKRLGPNSVTLVVTSPHVRLVLSIVHFDEIFRIVDSATHI